MAYVEPVKVNILDNKGTLKYELILVGNCPQNVRKELESKNPKAEVLERAFGKQWKQKLFMTKTGGDTTDDDFFSLDDLKNLDAPVEKVKIEVKNTGTVYSYVDVFSFDTILEFKRKLEYVTNIPFYCQHLNYFYLNKYFSCMYTLEYKRNVFHSNIFKAIQSSTDMMEDISINTTYVEAANYIKIKTYDFAIIMSELRDKYNVREYNLFDMRDFITSNFKSKIKSNYNETQLNFLYYGFILPYFPVLTQSVFTDFINLNSKDFASTYPDTVNPNGYKKMIDDETSITYESIAIGHNAKVMQCLQDKTKTGIQSCIVQVYTKYKKSNILQIRNLFDMLPLTDEIISSVCTIDHESGRYTLKKTYKKNTPMKITVDVNQITYKILFDHRTTNYMYLTFNRNGNYHIQSSFLEENEYDFHDIVKILSKIINPIISRINLLKKTVLIGNNTIELMRFENARFIEVNSFIIWKAPVSNENYKLYIEILIELSRAKILTFVDSGSVDKFMYNKGVYQIDIERIEKNIELKNYYEFLTNMTAKHVVENLFQKNRVMEVENRNFDMKIVINGMRDKEYATYVMYIMYTLQKFSHIAKTNEDSNNVSNKSKALKLQDPALYNFKKLYGTDVPFSKICQKPFQPIILPAGDKRKGIKYWNFTTKSPAYYHCPNPAYPNLTFIVKKHPKGYCLPCCKKNDMDDSRSKSAMYRKCLDTHIFEDETKMTETRYIMNYGKHVDVGRVSRLPDKFVKQLIHSTYSNVENISELHDYMIYGVPQVIAGVKSGILASLLVTFKKSIDDIIDDLINEVNKNSRNFSILLNGLIYKYFSSHKDLTNSLHLTFIIKNNLSSDVPWNDIIKDILFYFKNINTIIFEDDTPYNSTITDINIDVPVNMINVSDFYSITNHLIFIKKNNSINPIYEFDSDAFFSKNIIEKQMFAASDQIVNVVAHTIEHFNTKENTVSNTLELNDIYEFNDYNKMFSLMGAYLNKTNLCYMVVLKYKSKLVYLPVKLVYYNISGNIEIFYEPFMRKNKNDIKTLNEFLFEYNKWMVQKNKKRMRDAAYKIITLDSWMLLDPCDSKKDAEVVGFMYKKLTFYVSVSIQQAVKIKNAPKIRLYYDPDIINTVIYNETKSSNDHRTANIYENLYYYNLYRLVVMEFMNFFSQNKNKEIRNCINKLLDEKNSSTMDIIYTKLVKFYSAEYKELDSAIKNLIHIGKDTEVMLFNKYKNFLINDINKLEVQINEFMKDNIDLAAVRDMINKTDYMFDFVDIHHIKNMSITDSRDFLHDVAKKIFKIKKDIRIKNNFPNVFRTCATNDAEFCEDNKLIVDKNKIDKYIDIFIQDVNNPLKDQWMLNLLFAENVFTYFEFIRRHTETIDVFKLW